MRTILNDNIIPLARYIIATSNFAIWYRHVRTFVIETAIYSVSNFLLNYIIVRSLTFLLLRIKRVFYMFTCHQDQNKEGTLKVYT